MGINGGPLQEVDESEGVAMDDESVLKFVSEYLKKKGFKQTENAFLEELQHSKTNNNNSSSPISSTSQFDPDIAKHILSFVE